MQAATKNCELYTRLIRKSRSLEFGEIFVALAIVPEDMSRLCITVSIAFRLESLGALASIFKPKPRGHKFLPREESSSQCAIVLCVNAQFQVLNGRRCPLQTQGHQATTTYALSQPYDTS